ncbi:MAG: AbrB/MazE/SpoVT family DNA-binding domain-containing protein [Candidatus Pacearchaeota archaeon]|nr:AbrB/MazE/SpoVT family DNA-binding domain-containing protein [Candidatus Pacearchaeota archaeon]
MKRKLVKQGAATMMISLPSKWIRANNLDKGDEIELEEKNNSLIISQEAKKGKKQTEINLSSLTESSIRTLITNAYRLGYNQIKLSFKDKKAIESIKDTINNNLLGFEIINKSDTSCEIENITEPSKEQFENIFSKIFLNIEDLFEITLLMLQGKKSNFEEVEKKIQQFDNFCRRVSANDSDSQLRWAFHAELIHAQREIYHLLRYLEKNKIKPEKEIFSLLEDCRKIFKILEQAYKEKSISLLEKIHEMEKEIVYKKGHSSIKISKNPIVLHHLLSAIRNFYLSSSPLIGIFIQEA